MRVTRVLVPSGALGLGWDADALKAGIARRPDIIAIDGGSTDSGPSYLGRGVSKYARASVRAEWGELLDAQAEAGCPLIIGTAGTCGAGSAVDWLVGITRELLAERGRKARIAVLKCDQAPGAVADAWEAGRLRPLDPAPDLDRARIESCTNIVALAGVEQVQAALDTGAEIVIAGRTTDTAIIAALPIARGVDPGIAWHAAKIGECGALCASDPQSGVLELDFRDDACVIRPLAARSRATPETVFSHMLYENSDPFLLHEPGGTLDVTDARYDDAGDGAVRISGAVWREAEDYTVKLEGARAAGYQTILLSLLRDADYVAAADRWAEDIRKRATEKSRKRLGRDDFDIEIRLIGANATLGPRERRRGDPVEIGALAIVTAPEQALATEIAMLVNPYLLHHPLTREEEQPTFAFPFSPAEIERGPAWEFALNHVLVLDDPMAAFDLTVQDA